LHSLGPIFRSQPQGKPARRILRNTGDFGLKCSDEEIFIVRQGLSNRDGMRPRQRLDRAEFGARDGRQLATELQLAGEMGARSDNHRVGVSSESKTLETGLVDKAKPLRSRIPRYHHTLQGELN